MWGFLGIDYPGVGGGGGGGGMPIFSFIFRFGALFLIKKFRKEILLGVRRFVDFFLGGGGGAGGEGGGKSLRNRTFLRRVISIHFRAF